MLAKSLASAAKAVEPAYIEDVFSTYLYTGNGSTQTITNGIDLAGEGGLVWIKTRNTSVSGGNLLFSSANSSYVLSSNSTAAQEYNFGLFSLGSSGFNVQQYGYIIGGDANSNGNTYASWTFRKQPKFFDIVTYTGTGLDRQVSHSLGSTPGCIIVKRTDTTGNWQVWHKDVAAAGFGAMVLNSNAAAPSGNYVFRGESFQTSTEFGVRSDATVNASGGTYVAYLFAHNAGGFGLSGSDNVISCGSFTTDGSGNATITLGYEPQWLLVKVSSAAGYNWFLLDTMRGIPVGSSSQLLQANLADAETTSNGWTITPTGFTLTSFIPSKTYIYIAIRRGPMKVPTSGTSVFDVEYNNQSGGGYYVNLGAPIDAWLNKNKATVSDFRLRQRLTGANSLITNSTAAETTQTADFFGNNFGAYGPATTNSDVYNWAFVRAPSFFDVVCYTGTGIARTVNHNLGVAPQLIIVKSRDATWPWPCHVASLGNNKMVYLNTTASAYTVNATYWNSTNPTASVFSLGTDTELNAAAGTKYVAYLFATCAGVSKVGSYTGNGSSQTINCGFAGGARFVLIKRTDSTGDWYVWDSARGIVAGNDPYLLLNSTAAEVTSTDYIDTYSAGFEISSTAPAAINANGGTFIFLAVS